MPPAATNKAAAFNGFLLSTSNDLQIFEEGNWLLDVQYLTK